jgi:uncharacterized small protein (TIGR04563 family)
MENTMAKKKLTLYFPEEMVETTKQEALRQDRSVSWVFEMAWKMSQDKIQSMPGIDELCDGDWEGAAE